MMPGTGASIAMTRAGTAAYFGMTITTGIGEYVRTIDNATTLIEAAINATGIAE